MTEVKVSGELNQKLDFEPKKQGQYFLSKLTEKIYVLAYIKEVGAILVNSDGGLFRVPPVKVNDKNNITESEWRIITDGTLFIPISKIEIQYELKTKGV